MAAKHKGEWRQSLEELELERRFTAIIETEEQRELVQGLSLDVHDIARHFLNVCPDSRERSLALTKLEESLMWAAAAIARGR